MKMKPLEGRTAIVTGAGRGIGKAIALSLARSGARVALASRSESELRAVGSEISAAGGEAFVAPTDLTQAEQIARLVESTMEKWGAIDDLVNNAGWGRTAAVVKGRVDDWDRTLQVNSAMERRQIATCPARCSI